MRKTASAMERNGSARRREAPKEEKVEPVRAPLLEDSVDLPKEYTLTAVLSSTFASAMEDTQEEKDLLKSCPEDTKRELEALQANLNAELEGYRSVFKQLLDGERDESDTESSSNLEGPTLLELAELKAKYGLVDAELLVKPEEVKVEVETCQQEIPGYLRPTMAFKNNLGSEVTKKVQPPAKTPAKPPTAPPKKSVAMSLPPKAKTPKKREVSTSASTTRAKVATPNEAPKVNRRRLLYTPLNAGSHSVKWEGKNLFEFNPPVVHFTEWEVGQTYSIALSIKNVCPFGKRVGVLAPASK